MSFFKSIFTVSFFTLFSRVFGYIRDIFFAKYLGVGFLSDIFFTAFKLPNFFRNIFAEGAFNSSFIPIFSSELAKSDKKDNLMKFTRNIFSILLYSLLVFTLFAEIFMPQIIKLIAPGFVADAEKFSLSIVLSRITFPYLIFISLVSFFSAILNSHNKFAAVSICPIILNITFIIFAIFSGCFKQNIAFVLSYAVCVGGVLQLLWLIFFTLKNKMLIYPVFPKIDGTTKQFFHNFKNSFISSGIMQLNSVIDSIFATLILNAQSYIYYADRISQLPLALIGTAISIVMLPTLSKKIALQEDSTEIQELTIFSALFLGIPSAIGLFCIADLAIPILFQRGEFILEDSIAVAGILKILSIALPLFILTKIGQTIFYANKDTKTPMKLSLISLITNVVLNFILIKFFSYRGIVYSTVIASFSNVFLLFYYLLKSGKVKLTDIFLIKLLKLVYINILLFLIISMTEKMTHSLTNSFFLELLRLGLIIAVAGISYLILSIILNLIDKAFIKKLLKR